MTADVDRITLVILKEDGTREKHMVRSWVGIPRKTELLWLSEEPYLVVEVEYALHRGFFGSMAIEAAGVYVRKLSEDEKEQVAKRLSHTNKKDGSEPFRA